MLQSPLVTYDDSPIRPPHRDEMPVRTPSLVHEEEDHDKEKEETIGEIPEK